MVGTLSACSDERPYTGEWTGGDTFSDCADCPPMIVLSGGVFKMGGLNESQSRSHQDSLPVRQVTVQPFAVGATEVTRAQFAAFVTATGGRQLLQDDGCISWLGAEGLQNIAEHNWHYPGFDQQDDHPVVCVSWLDAQAYVAWLSELTGQHYRLLSEAEWEYAARSGSTSIFSFGNSYQQLCIHANISDKTGKTHKASLVAIDCDDGYAKTSPVGSFQSNDFGLYDIHGNVWEWVQDCYHDNYQGAPMDSQAWLENCAGNQGVPERMLRGGGWEAWADMMASASRLSFAQQARKDDFGFRVARDLVD